MAGEPTLSDGVVADPLSEVQQLIEGLRGAGHVRLYRVTDEGRDALVRILPADKVSDMGNIDPIVRKRGGGEWLIQACNERGQVVKAVRMWFDLVEYPGEAAAPKDAKGHLPALDAAITRMEQNADKQLERFMTMQTGMLKALVEAKGVAAPPGPSLVELMSALGKAKEFFGGTQNVEQVLSLADRIAEKFDGKPDTTLSVLLRELAPALRTLLTAPGFGDPASPPAGTNGRRPAGGTPAQVPSNPIAGPPGAGAPSSDSAAPSNGGEPTAAPAPGDPDYLLWKETGMRLAQLREHRTYQQLVPTLLRAATDNRPPKQIAEQMVSIGVTAERLEAFDRARGDRELSDFLLMFEPQAESFRVWFQLLYDELEDLLFEPADPGPGSADSNHRPGNPSPAPAAT